MKSRKCISSPQRNSHNTLYQILLLFLLLSVCKEPYEFDTKKQNEVLVVDGSINDQEGPYTLILGTTTSNQNTPNPMLGASAYVNDDRGNSENYVELGNGVYQLSGTTIRGTPGRLYTLHIILSNGKTYQSTDELMPTVVKPTDSLFYKVVETPVILNNSRVENTFISVYLNTAFHQNNEGYFRWIVKEVYSVIVPCNVCPNCVVYQPTSLYNLNVITRTAYSGDSLKNVLLISRALDYTFASRHYFNVTQNNMNSTAYAYWASVQKLIANMGTIFQSPPYTIRGNMVNVNDSQELVVGYFEASTQKLTRIHLDRGFIPKPVPTCFNTGTSDPPAPQSLCNYCLSLPGSTTVFPNWF